MKYIPHRYQLHAEQHVYNHPSCGLFLGCGLGKTVIALTAVDKLLHDFVSIRKCLVIAPLFVASHVWTDEAAKWDHLRHLRIVSVLGDQKQRISAVNQSADVYIINRENVEWLVGYHRGFWPYDCVIIDELSSFKSNAAKRFKALKQILPQTKRVIGLTGTPAPNSLLDLWAPMYLLDRGERLEKFITHYRDKYFNHYGFKYSLKKDAEAEIYAKIADICISMKSSDWLDLPETLHTYVNVNVPDQSAYDEFEKEQIMHLVNSDEPITAANAAVLTGKLLQFANGAVYDDKHNWHELHRAKLDALYEYIENLNGENLLLMYQFKHDKERIMKRFRCAVDMSADKDSYRRWNAGKIKLLIAHPKTIAYGMNMQSGGHNALWFGHGWSLELYLQANARLARQGQERRVTIGHIVASKTIENRVLQSLTDKASTQDSLMDAVKALILKYK